MADPYTTLGIERNATQDDIKRAYRRLAHKYHPDKDGGDEERFKEVNAAYQVLSDEQKRAQYDQFGQTFEGGGGAGPFNGGFNVNMDDLGDLGGIFNQFFGGRTQAGTRQQVRRGQDVAIDTTISFAESARGTTKETTHRVYQACSHCRGNGAEPGTPIKECPTCGGQGTVSTTQQTVLGVFTRSTVCTTCHGEGKRAETPCSQCRGEGRELKDRVLEVAIPAGIADGQTIRIAGKGEAPAHGGTPGDLFVTVHVKPDKKFHRDGSDIRSNINISFADAALGTTVSASTLKGEQSIDIPAGTQPGAEFKLSGQGFPSLEGTGRGDHIVTANIVIPKRLSRPQRRLLEEYRTTKQRRRLFG